MGEITVVLGGTRSGKSRFALARARELGGDRVTFVATARPGDPDLDERIAGHRRVRPATWRTLETDQDLAKTLALADPNDVLLIDSLTLWVSACLDVGADVRAGWDAASALLAGRGPAILVVSDEVGLGVMPPNALARRFLDELGMLHQRIAAQASRVVLVVAGVPVAVKGAP